MTKSKASHGAIGYVSYHAERPFITMPKVVLVNGMYEDSEGKQYIPEMFDKFFKGVKGVIKDKSFKGELMGNDFL